MYNIYTNKLSITGSRCRKIWLIMRLVILFLTIGFINVSAASSAQTLTIKGRKLAFKTIFAEITKQTGYTVLYGSKVIQDKSPLTLDLKQVPLSEALEVILKNQDLDFSIEDRAVIIEAKKKSLFQNFVDRLKAFTLRGKLVDENGTPIPGATIRVFAQNLLTISDANGSFQLNNVEENSQILITSIGFQPSKVSAKEDLGEIVLRRSDTKLDEVQVQAYGTVSKRLSTGNIASLKASEIDKQPVNNPILALQGRIPGVVINQTSGNAGSNITVNIQGRNSIAAGNDPFYVIDGVPYPSQNLTSLVGTSGGGSPLAFLNPETIESIEILKDADATSIYGSRAANGAILITTKKGKSGGTKIDLNLQQGIGEITKKSKLLNTQQYMKSILDAFANDGTTTTSSAYTSAYGVNGVFDPNRNVDWQETLAGRAAHYQDYQLAVSGGNDLTTFMVGANYHKEGSVYVGDLTDDKKSFQVSLSNHSANKKFYLDVSANYLNDRNLILGTGSYNVALQLAPNAPELYNSDGSLNFGTLPNGTHSFNNPLGYTLQGHVVTANNLLANGTIGYEFLPGLNLKSAFGFNRLETDEFIKNPLAQYNPDYYYFYTRNNQTSNRTIQNLIIEPQLSYKRKLAGGVIDGLLGATFQHTKNQLLGLQGTGFTSDSQLDNIQAATTISVLSTDDSRYKYNALFARLNYVYAEKYIFNATVRRDGSSRFGPENKFNTFYSIAGGYVFSEEKFMRDWLPSLSFGKLKASYGTTGSDQIANYAYLDLYRVYGSATVPYQGATSLYPTSLNNPYLQWEETKKLNLGLDLGFIHDRILLSANYYRNTSSNELVSSPLPGLTGFGSIQQNLPATVRNTGWEFSVDAQPVLKGNFRWTTSINFTVPKNELVEFPNLDANPIYRSTLVVGQPIGVIKLFDYQGVNPQTGLYQYLAANGQLTSNPNFLTDRNSYVNPFPKYYGGINNSFTYKQFQFDFLIQYVNQRVLDNLFGLAPGGNINSPSFVADHWTQVGQVAQAQRLSRTGDDETTAHDDAESSTGAYRNGSYARLKNASISWSVPTRYISHLGMRNIRVFVQGQNLITITKLNRDPETSNYSQLPTLRVVTGGIHIGI